jgi:magnesium transporter
MKFMTFRHKYNKKLATPPGTPTYVGTRNTTESAKAFLHTIKKDSLEGTIKTVTVEDKEFTKNFVPDPTCNTWLEVCGNQDIDFIKQLGEHFNLHPLIVEDILNSKHQPKLDDFDDYVVIFLRRSYDLPETIEYESEQICIIIFKDIVISISEYLDDFFDPIKKSMNRFFETYSSHENDFLAYSLIDFIIDSYYLELDLIENEVEVIENEINQGGIKEAKDKIFMLKRKNLGFRKLIWPLREIASNMRKLKTELISNEVKFYLRDLNDHLLHITEIMEINRDLINSLRENYNSELNLRMNSSIYTLTIISTIILPLTFITSLYGMNFEYMPELTWKYGYLAVWILLLFITSIMLVFFKKKRFI